MNWLPLPVKWLPADFAFFLWARKIQGAAFLARARVLVSKLFIPCLSLLVMA